MNDLTLKLLRTRVRLPPGPPFSYILETDPSQGPEEVFSDVDAMDILAGSGPESPGKWIWKFAKKDRWTDADAELKYLNLSEYERQEYVKYLEDKYGSYFYGT